MIAFPAVAFANRNSWLVFRRNLLAWQKYMWSSVAINILEPIGYLLTLGFGLGAWVTLGQYGSLAQFVAPGLLGVVAVNAATFDAAWGCFERLRLNGVYESMVTAPVDPLEIAAGEYLWQGFRATVYGSLFLAVTAAFGLVHSWWALLIPPLLGLTGIVFAIPAFFVAMIVRAQEHLFYYFSMVVGPTIFVAGVFFPLDRLPHWLIDIAWITPLYHVAFACRALVYGRLDAGLAGNVVWLVVAGIVLCYLPVIAVRRRLGN